MQSSEIISLICTSILIVILICITPILLKKEIMDIKKLNKEYDKIKKTNIECTKYIQAINGLPTWRRSLILSFVTVTIIFIFLGIVSSIPNISKISLLCIGYWFSFILMFISIYKMANHYNWHYLCRGGCVALGTYKIK